MLLIAGYHMEPFNIVICDVRICLLYHKLPIISSPRLISAPYYTGKNNGFQFLDILGSLKNTHKNPKFGKVRQVTTREFPTKFPDWDMSHSSKFGIFVGIL